MLNLNDHRSTRKDTNKIPMLLKLNMYAERSSSLLAFETSERSKPLTAVKLRGVAKRVEEKGVFVCAFPKFCTFECSTSFPEDEIAQ